MKVKNVDSVQIIVTGAELSVWLNANENNDKAGTKRVNPSKNILFLIICIYFYNNIIINTYNNRD